MLLTSLAADANVPGMGAPSECGNVLVCAEGEPGLSRPAGHIGHGYWLSGVSLSVGRAGEYPHIWTYMEELIRENEVAFLTGIPQSIVHFKFYGWLQYNRDN